MTKTVTPPPARATTAPAESQMKLNTTNLKSSYCNMCSANTTREEVVLNFGINQNWDAYNGSDRYVNNWSAALALQIPIFTGGQREIDMRTAQHQIDQARLNYERTGKAVQEELKAAWLNVRTLKETIKALHAEVEAAAQNYKDLKVQYQAGTATSLDVQIALREVNNSRTILATQTYDYQVALRELQRAQAAFQPLRVTKAADMLQLRAPKRPAR